MSGRPVGPDRQESLVSGCSSFVFPAIAEYPSAQMDDFFSLGKQIEGAMGALERIVAASLVV
jgi:hypothetical protein